MKKFIAIMLSICLMLGVCAGAFASEIDGKSVSEDAQKIIKLLPGLAVLGESGKTDKEGADGTLESYLSMLLGEDVDSILSGERSGYIEAALKENIAELMALTLKYADGKLSKDELLEYIRYGNESGKNLLDLDEQAFREAVEGDKFSFSSIEYILDVIGLTGEDENGNSFDPSEYEDVFFILLLVLNLVEFAYPEEESVDALGLLKLLYEITRMYEKGELTEEELYNLIKDYDLQGAVLAVVYTESVINSVGTASTETVADYTEELKRLLANGGLTPEQIEEMIEYYGLEQLRSVEDVGALAAQYKENEQALVNRLKSLGLSEVDIGALRGYFTFGYMFGMSDKEIIDTMKKAEAKPEITEAIEKATLRDRLAELGYELEEVQEIASLLLKAHTASELNAMDDAALKTLADELLDAKIPEVLSKLGYDDEQIAYLAGQLEYARLKGEERAARDYINSFISGLVDARISELLAAYSDYTEQDFRDWISHEGSLEFLLLDEEVLLEIVHAKGEHHEAVAPTCIEDGNVEYWDCKICGAKFDSEGNVVNPVIPATGIHTKSAHHGAVTATCTEDGNVEYWDCEYCGAKLDADGNEIADPTIAATGHAKGTHHAATAATCTEDGNEEYWDCEYCGAKIDADGNEIADPTIKAGHVKGTHHEAAAATCTENGNVEYWDCKNCGAKVNAAGNVIANPEIKATGHAKGTHHEAVTATCEEDGNVEYWECANGCGAALDSSGNVIGNPIRTGHTRGNYYAYVAPTCTRDGNVVYWTCIKCGAPLNAMGEVIDPIRLATGHNWQLDEEHTDRAAGTFAWKCTKCDIPIQYTPSIDIKPHQFLEIYDLLSKKAG